MKHLIIFSGLIFITTLTFHACKKDKSNRESFLLSSDFKDGKDGWQAGFSEYNGNSEEIYELEEGLAMLPAPLDESKQAYKIAGMNRSDDLFMYLTRKIDGLKPNTLYRGTFVLDIASEAVSGGVGAGGAPGEGVGVGIGLVNKEPISEPDDNNFYKMNIDKIQQCCTDGKDMIVVGDIANGTSENVYKMIERTGEFAALSNDEGNLWVIVGTDSGYEGKTTLYYSQIDVLLNEL